MVREERRGQHSSHPAEGSAGYQFLAVLLGWRLRPVRAPATSYVYLRGQIGSRIP